MLTYSRLEFSRKKADDVSLSPFKEMHCRKNSNLPSSSSSSPKSGSASPVSPSKQKQRPTRDLGFLWSRRDQAFQPRLTRQRKLRHLSDVEVDGLASNDRHSTRTAFSANSTPFSCSPNSRGRSSVAPLPLPLPDLPALLRRRPDISASSSGRFPLPSPKEVQSTSRDEDDRAENLNGMFSTSSPGSMLSYHFGCRGPEKSRKVPTRSANSLDTIVLQDSDNAENSKTLRLSVPAKSAPNSGRSSPVRSPRRLSTGDQLAPLYASSPELQFWFAPEFPPSDMMISGFPSWTSPEKICGQSPEWSPLQSPAQKSPAIKSSNPSGTATSLHSKISSEKSSLWHDNGLVTVHPLPLPPAVANPSHLPLGHQSPVKSEVSSMASQWKKGKLIGSGTFGHVYVATNRETGALCAMKEVNLIPDDPKSTECMMQLEQEIKVLSQLKHPNIVQYYGSEIAEDRFYIYLEFVHPGSISKYVREHCGAMTESVVRNFTRHILSGLAYLHSTNTIHRDIKGANLLVDAFGVVKLADFGMAKHLSGQAAALSLKGSPYWMAPEVMQAMMQKDGGYDLAVDIWSLGCTIVEMFTGKPPWSGFEGAAAMFKVLKNECPPIPETLSAEGKDFLQCCFQRNPADRPSASALLEHRFVKNSSHSHEIPGCIQTISQMKLTDVTQSPRDRSNLIQTRRRRPLSNGETSQSHPETSKSAAGPRHSPRSTLEAIHSIYSPPSSHLSGPSSNIINKFCSSPGGGNSRFYSLAGFHGRELLHPS